MTRATLSHSGRELAASKAPQLIYLAVIATMLGYRLQLLPIVMLSLALGATASTFRRYGCGIAQEIDTAAMTVYLKYQHYDADVIGLSPTVGSLDSAEFVSAGALINF